LIILSTISSLRPPMCHPNCPSPQNIHMHTHTCSCCLHTTPFLAVADKQMACGPEPRLLSIGFFCSALPG
jgi:hypothetical protein